MYSQIVSDPRYSGGSGDVHVFDSGNKGPTVLVVSGVHGNETGPIEAVNDILISSNEVSVLPKGKLFVVPHGNPDAVKERARDIDGRDLNRLFGDFVDRTIDPNMMGTSEQKRAMFLKGIISQGVTHLLDLHSLSGQSLVPFLYCPDDPEKIAFAQQLGVSHIVIGWAKLAEVLKKKGIMRPLRPGLADYANMQKGVTGLTFEAGNHLSPDASLNTIKFLANALAVLGMDGETRVDHIGGDETVLIDMVDVYLGNNSEDVQFEWVIEPVNFMQFTEKTLVARDHGEDVYMEANTILVQPKTVPAMRPGQEAFFIGKHRQQ